MAKSDDKTTGRDNASGGKSTLLSGTKGNDVLTGTAGKDLILGKSGNDTLNGAAGNDKLIGNAGNDNLLGGAGNDRLKGSSGNDTLDGGAGSDELDGGSGNDLLIYRLAENGRAHDRYDGGAGSDTLRLEFTGAEWARADVQADVARFRTWLDGHRGNGGEHRDDDNDGWFQFRAFDLEVRKIENLEIRVDGVPPGTGDRPVDAVDDTASVREEGTVSGNVLGNDSVPDGVRSVALVSGPAHGALTLNADGNYSYTPGAFFDSLADGRSATESFTYRVTDTDGDTDTATVTLTITGTNDGPVARADSATTGENQSLDIVVLANDTDIDDGAQLRVIAASVPAGQGSVTINADSTIAFNPGTDFDHLDAGQPATVVVSYTISDEQGATSSSTATITVTGANDAPVIAVVSDSGAAREDTVLTASGQLTASDVDDGATQSWSVVGGGTGTYGSLTVDASGAWTYTLDNASAGVQALAQGETVGESFTIRVTDDNGAAAEHTVSLAISGTNDAPEIVAGSASDTVFEDGPRPATGQLVAHDVDQGAVLRWSVDEPMTARVDYRFVADNLHITKNGLPFFDDDFGNGLPPPTDTPSFAGGNPASYSTSGVFLEEGGRLIMGSALAGPALSVGTADPFVGHFATLLSNNDSTDSTRGLKSNSSFVVEGRFDLVLPDELRETYGVRLSDRFTPATGSQNPGDDTVEAVVRRGTDGVVAVQFRDINFAANTVTTIGSVPLNMQPGEDQIVLRLSHDTPNTDVVRASFDVFSGSSLMRTVNIGPVGHIFGTDTPGTTADDESWTRASIVAYAPAPVLNGVYGALSIDNDGHWTYALNNGAANVQALAQGEIATDTFTARVADEHGVSATQTVAVAVTGTDDAPVITGGPTFGFVTEDSNTQTATGRLSAFDLDHGASLTWSVSRSATGYSSDYYFALDDLTITKNGGAFFQDEFNGFNNGTTPLLAPNFADGTPASYQTNVRFTEQGGRLIVDGSRAGTISGVGNDELVASHSLLLNTDIDPSDLSRGLKIDDDFTVEARFDTNGNFRLTNPGQGVGIALNDRTLGSLLPDQLGDDAVSLRVVRDATGTFIVQLEKRDSVDDVTTVLGGVVAGQENDGQNIDYVVLRLAHEAAHPGVVHGSFDLIRAGSIVRTEVITETAHIFGTDTPNDPSDDENWTRAQVVAYGEDSDAHTAILQGTYGSLHVDDNGQWTYDLDSSAANVQALNQGQSVTDSFTVRVTDEYGLSSFRPMSITVNGANEPGGGGGGSGNLNPVANNDAFSTALNTTLNIAVSAVLANDSDPDGGFLSISSFGTAAHGLVFLSNGAFSYTPNNGFSGSDGFGYTINDGQGGSASAFVSINVGSGAGGGNHNPVAVDDVLNSSAVDLNGFTLNPANGHYYKFVPAGVTADQAIANAAAMGGYLVTITSAEENAFVQTLSGGGYIGASDAAEEGVWRWIGGPEAGQQFWLGGSNGAAVGGQYANWHQGEPTNQGIDPVSPNNEDFAHMYTDGTWNDLPGNVLISYTVEIGGQSSGALFSEDAVRSIGAPNLLANDTDSDHDILSVVSVSPTSMHGASVSLSGTTILYDPRTSFEIQALAQGQTLSDQFSYTISDGHGGSATATVTVPVSGADELTITSDPANPQSLTLTVAPTAPGGSITVYWGDDSSQTQNTGAGPLVFTHTYAPNFHGVLNVGTAGVGLPPSQYQVQIAPDHTTQRISALPGHPYVNPSISSDGQTVVFSTLDPVNILTTDVSAYHRDTGVLQVIAAGSSTAPVQNLWPLISADGEFVAYTTGHPNPDFPGTITFDSHVASTDGGFTQEILPRGSIIDAGGMQALVWSTGEPSVSGDGRLVALDVSYVSPTDPNDFQGGIFLVDRVSASVTQVSGAFSAWPIISADGASIAFQRWESGGYASLYIHDFATGATDLVPNSLGAYQNFSLSADGRYLAFSNSQGSNPEVFVYDHVTHQLEFIADGVSPSISADGLHVAFVQYDFNTGMGSMVQVFDRDTGTFHTVSYTYPDLFGTGQPFGGGEPSISGDGRFVAYTTAFNDVDPTSDIAIVDRQVPDAALTGTDSPDLLMGGNGNDTLTGGAGADALAGGSGADRFVYHAASEGRDTITDFTRGAGGDKLDIKDLLVGYNPGTSALANFVQLAESGGSTTVSVNADGAGSEFVALAVLQGQTGLLLNELLANGNLIVS